MLGQPRPLLQYPSNQHSSQGKLCCLEGLVLRVRLRHLWPSGGFEFGRNKIQATGRVASEYAPSLVWNSSTVTKTFTITVSQTAVVMPRHDAATLNHCTAELFRFVCGLIPPECSSRYLHPSADPCGQAPPALEAAVVCQLYHSSSQVQRDAVVGKGTTTNGKPEGTRMHARALSQF
jgi:hypothetical protein